MEKIKWYNEKTFRLAFAAILILGALFTIGISIVDRQFNPIALYGIGIILPVMTLLQFLYKK